MLISLRWLDDLHRGSHSSWIVMMKTVWKLEKVTSGTHILLVKANSFGESQDHNCTQAFGTTHGQNRILVNLISIPFPQMFMSQLELRGCEMDSQAETIIIWVCVVCFAVCTRLQRLSTRLSDDPGRQRHQEQRQKQRISLSRYFLTTDGAVLSMSLLPVTSSAQSLPGYKHNIHSWQFAGNLACLSATLPTFQQYIKSFTRENKKLGFTGIRYDDLYLPQQRHEQPYNELM